MSAGDVNKSADNARFVRIYWRNNSGQNIIGIVQKKKDGDNVILLEQPEIKGLKRLSQKKSLKTFFHLRYLTGF